MEEKGKRKKEKRKNVRMRIVGGKDSTGVYLIGLLDN